MKISYLLSVMALCLCTQLQAQIQKGKVLIGASSNLVGNFTQEDDTDAIPFYEIKGGASFFLSPHISLDLFANAYGAEGSRTGDGFKITNKTTLFGIGIGLNVFLSKKEKASG
ncbi:MAG: hypothetical protein R2830_09785 [Saprospiraceae bacterium]